MEDTRHWYESKNAGWNHRRQASSYHFDTHVNDINREDIKINFVKFEGDWSDDLENTKYELTPPIHLDEYLTRNSVQEYLELGIDYKKNLSQRAYVTPESHPTIWKMIEASGLADPYVTVIGQRPGEMQALHIDTICCNNIDRHDMENYEQVNQDKESERFMIALEDWQWGQFFQMGNVYWTQWKAGHTMWFDWRTLPHATANAGHKLRPMLKVTGRSTPAWQDFLNNQGTPIQI